jgi:hypothetical protein
MPRNWRIRCGVAAEPHQRVGDGVIEHPREVGEEVRALPLDDAATGVDHRPLGREQEPRRLANLAGMARVAGDTSACFTDSG